MLKNTLLAVLLLSACSSPTVESPIKANKVVSSSETEAKSIADEFLISADGIGKAKLGMTIGELKKILDGDTKFEVVSPLMVDVNAIAVSQDGLVQYYVLYPAGTTSHLDKSTPTDNDPISLLMTDNYNYQTNEGVGAGTPIKEAEDIYGNAVLSYNLEGESREYITFSDGNLDNINFRTSYFKSTSDGLGLSGIYPKYPGVAYTTDKYREDAAIASVEVSCTPELCSYGF
jgi:hypothetical protein